MYLNGSMFAIAEVGSNAWNVSIVRHHSKIVQVFTMIEQQRRLELIDMLYATILEDETRKCSSSSWDIINVNMLLFSFLDN